MTDQTNTQDNKDKRKLLRRTAAVVLMFAALAFSVWFMQEFMCIPFNYDSIRVINLHKEPENSIDVLLVGSSATYSDFSSPYAYEKFGFTSYPYAIGGSTCTMWKPAVKDALDRQKPKLIVVDVFGGGYERELIETRNNQLSIVMSQTAWSKEKVETAGELAEQVSRTSVASFLFPFIKYHNNVPLCVSTLPDRLRLEASGPSPLKGLNTLTRSRWLRKVDPASFTDESVPLDEKTEALIVDFIDYCHSQDIDVLFVKYPSVLTEFDPDELEVNRRANRILEIAGENGCETLNMQKHFHDIGLKERKDFYNHGHANTRGQKKITEYLGKYLRDNMGIGPSELSDDVKAEWDEAVRYWDAYQAEAERMTQENIAVNFGDEPLVLRQLSKEVNK